MNKPVFYVSMILIFMFFRQPGRASEDSVLKGKYLIVLDIQEHSTKMEMDNEKAESLINNINLLIELSDSDKVIYIESISAKLVVSLTGLYVEFDEGLSLDHRLNIINDNKFVKNEPNAFTSEQLVDFIRKKNARDFVVVGLLAEHCIAATLQGGEDLGFNMYFINEAIAGITENGKTEALQKAVKMGAEELQFDKLKLKN